MHYESMVLPTKMPTVKSVTVTRLAFTRELAVALLPFLKWSTTRVDSAAYQAREIGKAFHGVARNTSEFAVLVDMVWGRYSLSKLHV